MEVYLVAYLDDKLVALMAVKLVALWECEKAPRLVGQSEDMQVGNLVYLWVACSDYEKVAK